MVHDDDDNDDWMYSLKNFSLFLDNDYPIDAFQVELEFWCRRKNL